MIPSVNRIARVLGVERPVALRLRKLLDGRLAPDTFPSVKAWLGQCYHRPRQAEQILCAANELLGGHGVESIAGEHVNAFWFSTRFLYVNQGDAYAPTLLFRTADGRWQVGDWGALVEQDSTLGSS